MAKRLLHRFEAFQVVKGRLKPPLLRSDHLVEVGLRSGDPPPPNIFFGWKMGKYYTVQ